MFYCTITQFGKDYTITTEDVSTLTAFASAAERDIYVSYVATGHITENGHPSVSSEKYRCADEIWKTVTVYHTVGQPAMVW